MSSMQKSRKSALTQFDWNHIRAFLATEAQGSLSAAASVLGQTQPTISRQITALEEDLDLTLFERGTRSMTLTEAGAELLEPVRQMAEAAEQVARIAAGQNQRVEGTVSITSSDAMAVFTLPACIAALRKAHPGIEIDLVPSNSITDLTRRDADIAIRHVRPTQPSLIARKIAEIDIAFYAAPEYVAAHGPFSEPEDLAQADFVAYDAPEQLLGQLQQMGFPVDRSQFRASTTNGAALFEMVRAGLGVSLMPCIAAEEQFGLVRVLPDLPAMQIPMWLVTHKEIHTSRRIRLVFDALADALTEKVQAQPSG